MSAWKAMKRNAHWVILAIIVGVMGWILVRGLMAIMEPPDLAVIHMPLGDKVNVIIIPVGIIVAAIYLAIKEERKKRR